MELIDRSLDAQVCSPRCLSIIQCACLSVTQLANHLKFQYKTSSFWLGSYEKCIWKNWFLMAIVINNFIFKYISQCISCREGFLIFWTPRRLGWAALWQLPLNTGSERAPSEWKWQSRGENAKGICLLLQTRPTAMWSVLFPFCLCQDYSRQQKSLVYKAWPEHSPKWPRLFSWSTVHLSVKRTFLLTYLLLHYFHRLSLFQSWFLWVLVLDKKICSHREGGICVTFSLMRGKGNKIRLYECT